MLPSDARRPASNGNTAAVGASVDDNSDFLDDFCGFLQWCVANVDAAEVLRVLEAFQNCALVARDAEQRVRYRPSPAQDSHLATLARLYVRTSSAFSALH